MTMEGNFDRKNMSSQSEWLVTRLLQQNSTCPTPPARLVLRCMLQYTPEVLIPQCVAGTANDNQSIFYSITFHLL